MTLIHVEHSKSNPYTMVNGAIAEDTRLSFKAKGIWFYAFSRPDDWKFYLSDLIKRGTDGRDCIRAGLKELEDAGYLWRRQGREEGGRMGQWTYTFYETVKKELPETDYPAPANPPSPETDYPTSVNPPLPTTQVLPSRKNNNRGGAVPPPDPSPDPVVVVSLRELGIGEELVAELAEAYGDDPQRVVDACDAVSLMNADAPGAAVRAALVAGWVPKANTEEQEKENREWLESRREKSDGQCVGGFKCEIGNGEIRFIGLGMDQKRNAVFKVTELCFKERVSHFVETERGRENT